MMQGYIKLQTTTLNVKPLTVKTFESNKFKPFTSDYTVVKPDPLMTFIESQDLLITISP
jgi:hypothetical protein